MIDTLTEDDSRQNSSIERWKEIRDSMPTQTKRAVGSLQSNISRKGHYKYLVIDSRTLKLSTGPNDEALGLAAKTYEFLKKIHQEKDSPNPIISPGHVHSIGRDVHFVSPRGEDNNGYFIAFRYFK